jgi:hypothetical protein
MIPPAWSSLQYELYQLFSTIKWIILLLSGLDRIPPARTRNSHINSHMWFHVKSFTCEMSHVISCEILSHVKCHMWFHVKSFHMWNVTCDFMWNPLTCEMSHVISCEILSFVKFHMWFHVKYFHMLNFT